MHVALVANQTRRRPTDVRVFDAVRSALRSGVRAGAVRHVAD